MSEVENGLLTYTAAARELGVRQHTVSDLAIVLGLRPKRMSNGRAKGLDARDLELLRDLLCGRRADAVTS